MECHTDTAVYLSHLGSIDISYVSRVVWLKRQQTPNLELIMQLKYLALAPVFAVLSGCGGEDSSSLNSNNPANSTGQFYGYHINNTQVAGLYLNIPTSGQNFTGRLSFQYGNCSMSSLQTLPLIGQKTNTNLSATASGNLDVDQASRFISFSLVNSIFTDTAIYQGTYSKTAGDLLRNPSNCSAYTLNSPAGWRAWRTGTFQPSTFQIEKTTGMGIRWSAATLSNAIADQTMIMVIDPAKESTANNAIVEQRWVSALPTIASFNNLSTGKSYNMVIQVFDQNKSLIAYGNQSVTF